MDGFWDTSAVVPLIFREIHSPRAQAAFRQADSFFAWDWMQVETEAALARRQARDRDWKSWADLRGLFQWVHLPAGEWPEIQKLNRSWRLRAADAAHLYAFRRVSAILPDLYLVSFDDEQRALASKKGFRLI